MSKRNIWTLQEDKYLKKLVIDYGQDWASISNYMHIQKMRHCTIKQCRQRWLNHLSQNLLNTPFTQQQQQVIFTKQKSLGNKWLLISQYLPGRSQNSIKNQFYMVLKRGLRRMSKCAGIKSSTSLIQMIKPIILSRILKCKISQISKSVSDILIDLAKDKQQMCKEDYIIIINKIKEICNEYNEQKQLKEKIKAQKIKRVYKKKSSSSEFKSQNYSTFSNMNQSMEQKIQSYIEHDPLQAYNAELSIFQTNPFGFL